MLKKQKRTQAQKRITETKTKIDFNYKSLKLPHHESPSCPRVLLPKKVLENNQQITDVNTKERIRSPWLG